MLDESHGGRGNFLESTPQDYQSFQPYECVSLMDELHKLFQLID